VTAPDVPLPIRRIIQGGMGVGVSGWRLARAVSSAGQLGVVSGTALDVVLARRLQLGDAGGHVRRALAAFPYPAMAERVLARFFVPGGKAADAPFRATSMPSADPGRASRELTVVANFVEVFLAKEGHDGPVGVNYLEKIQLPTLPSLYGALLAGVSVVIMGAGIPRAVPGAIDALAAGREAQLPFTAPGVAEERRRTRFDPREFAGNEPPRLARPAFLPIVSSSTLAEMLLRKSTGRVDGFVVEGPTAGGHNAPPRGELRVTDDGEPIYGERDRVDPADFVKLGLPFWLAGSRSGRGGLAEALAAGAAGIQVGTAFAFCAESGVDEAVKRRVLEAARAGAPRVKTSARASPTGFPFKMLPLDGAVGDPRVVRGRVCDLGYLRHAVASADGSIVWRCPAEPQDDYLRKGGDVEDTRGRVCVCNGLLTTVGLGQVRAGGRVEPPLITSGDDVAGILRFVRPGATSYSARDVVDAVVA
jgi:nitronate monooxygenase